MSGYDIGGGRSVDAVLNVGSSDDDSQGGMGFTSPAAQAAYSQQRAGERQAAYQAHLVRDPDTGNQYRVFAPQGVSAARVMELAGEQIARMGQDNATGLKAQLVTPDEPQAQRPQLSTAQKVVRQGAAPLVGSVLGGVAGGAAAPFTGGVLNPLTGSMIGGAVGEAVNQYLPGWNDFTQSVKDPAAIVGTGVLSALPGLVGAGSKVAAPAARAVAGLADKASNTISSGLGGAAGLALGAADLLHGGMGALSGLALKHAPGMLARALASPAGRAALNGIANESVQAAGQAGTQAARVGVMNTTTGDLDRQMRGRAR